MKRKVMVVLGLCFAIMLFFVYSLSRVDAINCDAAAISDVGTFEDWNFVDNDSLAFESESFSLKKGEKTEISFYLDKAGTYLIGMQYYSEEDIISTSTVTLDYEEGIFQSPVTSVWQLGGLDYPLDRYGNEVVMEQTTSKIYATEYLRDVLSLSALAKEIPLAQGEHTFTLTSDTVDLEVERLFVVEKSDVPKASFEKADGQDFIVIEAEQYAAKSDSFISSVNYQTISFSPYNLLEKRINCIDSFKEVGQKVIYNFTLENAGTYYITFHYNQSEKEGMDVYRNIKIDGQFPNEALISYPFGYTGQNQANLTLETQGTPISFYLEAGQHTLSLEVDATPMEEYRLRIQTLIDKLSDLGMELNKLAGQSASQNRTWRIEEYIPGITEYLEECREEILQIYDEFPRDSGENPSDLVNLQMAAKMIANALKKPEKLPLKTTLISEGSGSAADLLSEVNLNFENQGITLDRIYIHNAEEKLPAANTGIWKSMQAAAVNFCHSLSGKKEQYADYQSDGRTLDIWVNRPLQYVEMMQIMADSIFTPETGIEVNLSVMPSEQKLILSNASGTAPDGAMNVTQSTPFDLALRGALADFTQFDDFADFVRENLYMETLQPYVLDDKVYGITETQDITVMFYRTDIFENLGLEPPETWQDVIDIMPVLLSNQMNIFLPPAATSGAKPIGSLAPFLFQMGGDLYDEDGIYSAIDSEAAIAGFKLVTDLFSLYSVEPTVANFYNSFRNGSIPVGIGDLNQFLRIKNAAPEIAGKWAIAPVPGIEQEDGEINRYMSAGGNACIILDASDMQTEVYEFYKWWLSTEIQNTYSTLMQTTYGAEYLWSSANRNTLSAMPFSEEEKEAIAKQREWIKEVPRHPALYAMERELSNAFLKVVNEGKSVRVAIDDAKITIDRENDRKLDEYGYLVDGIVVKEFRNQPIELIIGEE